MQSRKVLKLDPQIKSNLTFPVGWGGWVGRWVGGWLEIRRVKLSQLPTKLKLKLKLSLAITIDCTMFRSGST